MTARDMLAEQGYHEDRLAATNRYVSGEGIACGLGVDRLWEEGGELQVKLAPGFALDGFGEPIVVTGSAPVAVNNPETDLPGDPTGTVPIHLYLRYDECSVETVPVPGSENACEEECTYNRIVETFDVVFEEAVEGEDPKGHKPVPEVVFPGPTDVTDESGDIAPDDPVLATMAREFHADHLAECRTGTDSWVYLGTFDSDGEDGEWARVGTGLAHGSLVYSNDMLYAGLSRHTADFRNPHQVRLDAGLSDTSRALLFAAHETDREPVTLRSRDGLIVFQQLLDEEGNPRKGLDLRIPDLQGLSERVGTLREDVTRLQRESTSLERYVLDKTMKYKLESYRDASETFGDRVPGDIAEEIVARTLTGIDNGMYTDTDRFGEFLFESSLSITFPGDRVSGELSGETLTLVESDPDASYEVDLGTQRFDATGVSIADGTVTITTSLFGFETLFAEVIDEVAAATDVERYREALAEFGEPIGEFDELPDDAEASRERPVVLELAVLQDQLCEAVDWLVEEDTPVDTRPVGRVFLGETGVDLRGFRSAPPSGSVRLFDLADPADEGIEVDVANADITSDAGFEPGSYGFGDSRTTESVTVVEPVISAVSLGHLGRDATASPIHPRLTGQPVTVGAQFNFSPVEGVEVTVTDVETEEEVTAEMTADGTIPDPSATVSLDVSDAGTGTYRVDVRGEETFSGVSSSATFGIAASDGVLELIPSTVIRGGVAEATFSRNFGGGENVFVLVERESFSNPEMFDNESVVREALPAIIGGGSVVDHGVTDDHVFAELEMSDSGQASFTLNSAALRPTQPVSRLQPHTVRITTTTDLSGGDASTVIATAGLAVRERFSIPGGFEPPVVFDPPIVFDPPVFDPDGPIVRDPSPDPDIVIRNFDTPGEVIIRNPSGTPEVEVRESSPDPTTGGTATLPGGSFTAPVRTDVAGLTNVEGIGSTRESRLNEAGVTDLFDLAGTDTERLADAANVSVETAETWRVRARELLDR